MFSFFLSSSHRSSSLSHFLLKLPRPQRRKQEVVMKDTHPEAGSRFACSQYIAGGCDLGILLLGVFEEQARVPPKQGGTFCAQNVRHSLFASSLLQITWIPASRLIETHLVKSDHAPVHFEWHLWGATGAQTLGQPEQRTPHLCLLVLISSSDVFPSPVGYPVEGSPSTRVLGLNSSCQG